MKSRFFQIVEQYDGSNWRVLASSHTEDGAESQLRREERLRGRQGYGFFSMRRVLSSVGGTVPSSLRGRAPRAYSDRDVAAMGTW